MLVCFGSLGHVWGVKCQLLCFTTTVVYVLLFGSFSTEEGMVVCVHSGKTSLLCRE